MRIPTRLLPAEHSVVIYHHHADLDVTLEDVKKPAYWTHVTRQIRPGHRVIVDAADLSWTATLMVRSVGMNEAEVAVLEHHVIDGPVPTYEGAESGYEIKFRGPRKFSVIRKADSAVVTEDIPTKQDAERWLEGHVKSQQSVA